MKKLFSKNSSGVKDLTIGKPMSNILGFALPLLFGLLFQQIYNLVDTIIVGQKLGSDALAAVGSTGSINFMILGFCIGICNGFAIPIAQTFGAKDFQGMKRFITNCVWMSIICAVVITIVVGLLTHQILVWMNTPDSIIEMAYIYIFTIFMGIPAIFLYNMVAGVLRSLGNSVVPVIFLIFSSVLNIILDLILIIPMGVMGAAVATVISQAISGVICLIYMIKKYVYLGFTKEDWRLDADKCKTLLTMGIPMGLQYSVTAIGSLILQTAVNGMGETVIASVAAGTKIVIFLGCPFDALGSTMATYGGQNSGAKRIDRINEGLAAAIKLGVAYSILAFLFVFIFGRSLAALFIASPTAEFTNYVRNFLIGNTSCYALLALVNIIRFLIQGMGYSVFAIIAGICEMAARGLAGALLVPHFGFLFVALASPLAWVFADAFLIPAFFIVRKRLARKFEAEAKA